MLNGLDPIIIFTFYKKLTPAQQTSVNAQFPIAGFVNKLSLPPIPIYLSESLTGLYIDKESKSIEVATEANGTIEGASPEFTQKPINSSIKIDLIANKDSIGLTVLSAVMDIIFPLITGQDYSITYLHGATTLFGGLLHSYSVDSEANTSLLNINLELIKGSKKALGFEAPTDNASSLNNVGGAPAGGAAPAGGGAASSPPIGHG